MTTERRQAKALDRALHDDAPTDELRPLTETADALQRSLAADAPPADRQRAMFLSGVAARGKPRFSPLRLVVPAIAIVAVLFAFVAGRRALPGEQLYPLREALNAVGIGHSPLAEVEARLHEATRLVNRAGLALENDADQATALAVRALEQLGPARDLLPDLNGQRDEKLHAIEGLEDRAVEIIAEASEEEESDDAAEDNGSDDSGSGEDRSGSDDGGETEDRSGSDSGSGSEGSDDSSGSGGSGSDDSNSGSSGSGSDDSGGDSSGSGSDGSGDSDSSGSG